MNNKPCLFFCGSVLNYEGLKRYKGETPAATIWIKGLLGGVIDNDIDVKCFSPVWDSLFPKGRLFPGKLKYLDSKIPQVLVRYLNFPFLRTLSVAYSLEREIINAVNSGNNVIAIINYNTYPYYCKALKKISKKYPQIPWINLVLDLDDPIVDDWAAFKHNTLGAAGAVFLSWWGFKNAPIMNKLHLDGGWSGHLPELEKPKKTVFLYAGKYATFGGIDEIIESIDLFKNEDVTFEFYGKDVYQPLIDLSNRDNRVRICGFVTDEELDKACKKATAFLSPREIDFQGTRMIFPSKILFYLKYQKPVISALLPGLSPDYNEILIVPSDNSPNAWAGAMNKVIHFSDSEFGNVSDCSKVLLEKKKWNNQAKILLDFIGSL